jgi:hypothetical protein
MDGLPLEAGRFRFRLLQTARKANLAGSGTSKLHYIRLHDPDD